MMKKIIYTFAFVFSLGLTSCSDWLEVLPPQDLVQDEYWKTQEDAEAVLMAAYKKFSALDEYWFMAGELRADMVVASSGNYKAINEGRVLPSNDLCKWDQYYQIISYCNFVIEYAPDAERNDDTFTPIELEGVLAEAVFLRSWVYFYLVKMYGNVPFILNAPKTDHQDFFLPLTDGKDILKSITIDLLKARFTDDYGDQANNKGRATKAAAHALLADIYLWQGEKGDYEKCIGHIDSILSDTRYSLLPGGLWFENYFPGNSLESVMEIQLGWLYGTGNSLYALTMGNKPMFEVSTYALELLYEDETFESTRKTGSIIPEISGKTPIPPRILKYSGSAGNAGKALRAGSDVASANWILYRLADLILMKAEALIQLGLNDEAFEYINMIRQRADLKEMLTAPASHDAAEDLLLEERARELAFEGKRWWDLVRMGKRNDYARERDFIKLIIENLPIAQQLVLENRLLNRDGWYWPIHDDELERNKNIDQNSYYAPFSKDRD